MSKDKKKNNFKFNSYWPYAAVLIVILILNFTSFSSSGVITTTPSKFFKFLKDGDIKVEIVNKEAKFTSMKSHQEVHRKSKSSQFLPIGLSQIIHLNLETYNYFKNNLKTQ